MSNKRYTPRLTEILVTMVRLWGRSTLKTLWKTRSLQINMIKARRRRHRVLKREGLRVPMALALSPTMRCNLSCEGCYSRFLPKEDEMPMDVIESVVGSAVEAGVFLFVITGGEPFMRPEMMNVYRRYRGALFLTVTNGTLIDESVASNMARSGNIFPVVSIEGACEQTDIRRGAGIHQKALECMRILKGAGIPFGFSAVLTSTSIDAVEWEEFIDEMVDMGATVGFFNEFIPLSGEEMHSVPDDRQLEHFKDSLDRMRGKKPIVFVLLPDDEYDETGRCMAVGGGTFHINAQGYIEPCPFAQFARENIRDQSFRDILRSPFLEAIREHPSALQHGDFGCALASNRHILEEIARDTGAESTRKITTVRP